MTSFVPYLVIICLAEPVFLSAGTCDNNYSYGYKVADEKPGDFNLLSERISVDALADDEALNLSGFTEEASAEGKWSDIDYKNDNPANWQPAIHWDRILHLAVKFSKTKDPVIKNNIIRAIHFWDTQKPVAGNYWWNAIGVPLKIGKALVLMGDALSTEQQTAALHCMELGIKKDFYDYHGVATGQNLVWLATVHIMMGVVQKDTAALNRAFGAIYKEVKVSAEEGIQYDYSFHQHGTILYSGGYGLGFTLEICKLVNWSYGTAFQFPAEKLDIVLSYILNGQQWMLRNQTMDYSSTGREISRHGDYTTKANSILRSCKLLIALNLPRKNELKVLAARLEGSLHSSLTGNRYFWKSDFLVHQTPKFYSSVKMTSSRVKGSESGNNENLQGYWLGQGVQFIMRNGKEYDEIFPVWDWRKLPGLLCEQKTGPLPLINWGAGSEGKKAFVGAVSDGRYGMAAYDYARDNVSGKRAWFCFDDEVVCMGAAINCHTDTALFQTMNQSLLSTDVIVAGRNLKPEKLQTGLHHLNNIRLIYQDSTAYFPGERTAVTVENDTQTGSWKNINNNPAAPAGIVTKQVFSAWIDLGKQVNNGNYLYTIVPGVSLSDAVHYNRPVKILANDSNLQAVWHQPLNLLQAAFYQPGKLKYGNNHQVSADRPVLLLASENDTEIILSCSNPENKGLSVTVTMNRELQCDDCNWSKEDQLTRFAVKLPPGNDAGKSISKKLIKIIR